MRDAPIFIIIGGQNEILETDLSNSYPTDITRELYGFVFILEHRYYGRSIPVDDLSIAKLQWLGIEQALADISKFIDHVRNNIVQDSTAPVILVGRQYGGTLAVWFHQLYPGIVSGVWASSAPVLARVDNSDVLKMVGHTFRDIGGDECYARIERGVRIAETLFANGQLGQLERQFAVCNLTAAEQDIRFLFMSIASVLTKLAESGS